MLPMNVETINATISSGTALSAAINLGAKQIVGVAMPAGWDAAAMTFQIDPGDGVFREMQSTSAVVSFTVAAGQYIAVDPAIWRGVKTLKLRSGTSGAPVNQTADRVIGLVVKPI